MCAIVGMFGVSAVDATWVAHRGKNFGNQEYLSTCYWDTVVDGHVYKNNVDDWDQATDSTDWGLNDEDWTDICRDLAAEGYCECIYYNGKDATIFLFNDKAMPLGKYQEWTIHYSCGPDFRVRLSVNNDVFKWF